MKVESFISFQGHKTFDNGQARITDANSDETSKVAERIASTVYHKNEPVLPKTYDNFHIQHVYEIEDPETMNARYNKVTNLFSNGIAERSVELEASYLSGLSDLSVSLQKKDGGSQ